MATCSLLRAVEASQEPLPRTALRLVAVDARIDGLLQSMRGLLLNIGVACCLSTGAVDARIIVKIARPF
jgi:hypothetical protein